MKVSTILLSGAMLGAVGLGGYWLGARWHTSGVAGDSSSTTASASPTSKRKLLYYRNPMGLADTSPIPKKDPMGMDYVPVYEGEDESREPASPNQVRISTEKIQRLGVRVDAVSMRLLGKTVRAAGRVEPDERRIFAITPKFDGYVERLHVNVTGQPVAKGQTLFEAYSPELVSAQHEYAIAVRGTQAMSGATAEAQAGMAQLAQSSLTRLRNWDFSPDQVAGLTRTGQVRRTVSFRSPVSGVVTEKKALHGMRFVAGETLYQVTDLSSVWIVADVSEQDVGLVRPGAAAKVQITSYPNQAFEGRITYVYPTMNAVTRTVPVRVELPNPGLRLKPSMYAQLELTVGGRTPVLTVPDSAVIDTGTRRMVLVQVKEGRFEPREVELGGRGENFVEIVKGVSEGEQVVVAANFLIDAESNLKAAVGALSGHAGHGSAPKGADGRGTAVPAAPAAVGHRGVGIVEAIDPKEATVSLHHGPITTLKWPAMTMEFKAANTALLAGLKTGQSVSFEFVERQPGEYVVTSITAGPPASAPILRGGR